MEFKPHSTASEGLETAEVSEEEMIEYLTEGEEGNLEEADQSVM